MFRQIIFAFALTLDLAGAASAEILPLPAQGETLWGLGTTGIMCYRAPCPWRGVFPVDQDGTRGRPLSRFDQRQPPPLRADDKIRARIEAAFEGEDCVLAEGHFEGETLVVRRLLGDCRGL